MSTGSQSAVARHRSRKGAAPLHERVVRELTIRIVSGEWPSGYLVLPESELCDLLGVSRTVLREGVRLLVDRGLLIVRKGKGTVVARRPEWDLLDPLILSEGLRCGVADIERYVREARHLLEPLVAGLAASRSTPEHLARLRELNTQLAEPGRDLPSYLDVSLAFHRVLAEASGNPLVVGMLAPVYTALGLWREARAVPFSLRTTNHDDHARILAAISAGDASQP